MKHHNYEVRVEWTGNDGQGTKTYSAYRRDHSIVSQGKPPIPASSDPAFRGDPTRHNPEELLVASLSSCHMLWYLHLCSANHITVVDYRDEACGVMEERSDGSGNFVTVTLKPQVTIASGNNMEKAFALHSEAHRFCFIANSVNFPVSITPAIVDAPQHP